jgi:hypothetical protein
MVWSRVLLLALFIALVVVRIPAVLVDGRFWAEEGVVYYTGAWNRPWLDALFAVHTGYLNMAASSATLLALHCVHIERAPIVTAFVALVIQTLPALLLASSRIPWVTRWPGFCMALILLLVPGGDAEVWLNSITSQFHLALCVGLILAMDTRRDWVGVLHCLVLAAAPLAGPISGTLAPLFLLRAWLDRSRARLLQTILLGVPTVVQAVTVLTHPEPARSIGIGPVLLLAVIGIQNVILPFAGSGRTAAIGLADISVFETGGIPLLPIAAALLGLGSLALALWWWGERAAGWFFAAGCVLAVCSYSTALTLGKPLFLLFWQGRYTFAPSVLLSLSLLALTASGPLLRRLVPTILIVWVAYTGLLPFFELPPMFAQGPNWNAEVAAWRSDPAHALRVWPTGWAMTLDPSLRPDQ